MRDATLNGEEALPKENGNRAKVQYPCKEHAAEEEALELRPPVRVAPFLRATPRKAQKTYPVAIVVRSHATPPPSTAQHNNIQRSTL